MSQNTVKILDDLDEEISRVKLMLNENGYHNGTALNTIVRRYRNELKQYRQLVLDDRNDGIASYNHL
jgi:hypothetical protein